MGKGAKNRVRARISPVPAFLVYLNAWGRPCLLPGFLSRLNSLLSELTDRRLVSSLLSRGGGGLGCTFFCQNNAKLMTNYFLSYTHRSEKPNGRLQCELILKLFLVGRATHNYRKIPMISPGARFSRVPKSFRARNATTKILNLKFTWLFFSHNFNTNNVNFYAKFNAYTLLSF